MHKLIFQNIKSSRCNRSTYLIMSYVQLKIHATENKENNLFTPNGKNRKGVSIGSEGQLRKSPRNHRSTVQKDENAKRLTRSSPSRRITADPSDIFEIIKELESENVQNLSQNNLRKSIGPLNSDNQTNHSIRNSLRRSPRLSSLLNISATSTITSLSNDSFTGIGWSEPLEDSTHNRSDQDEISPANIPDAIERRLTVDRETIMMFMDEINLSSSITSSEPFDRSTLTNDQSKDSSSIGTIALVNDVRQVISSSSWHGNTSKDSEPLKVMNNTVGSFDLSDTSNMQSSPGVPFHHPKPSRSIRRETVDPYDIELLLMEFKEDTHRSTERNKPIDMEMASADLRPQLIGSVHEDESTTTIDTFGLIEEIEDIISKKQSGPVSSDRQLYDYGVGMVLHGDDGSDLNDSCVTMKCSLDALIQSQSEMNRHEAVEAVMSHDGFSPIVSTSKPDDHRVLKSCLSQSVRKVRPNPLDMWRGGPSATSITESAFKKSVVFISPEAAEFRKNSPTTNFTPLEKSEAKSLFSMRGSSKEVYGGTTDQITLENQRILEEWDRLTNASSGSDEDLSGEEESKATSDHSSVAHSRGRGRRLSKLHPHLDFGQGTESLDDSYEELGLSCLSKSVASVEDDMTHTVQLPSTLADLIQEIEPSGLQQVRSRSESEFVLNVSMESDSTKEIEVNLLELLQGCDHSEPVAGQVAVGGASEDRSLSNCIERVSTGRSIRGTPLRLLEKPMGKSVQTLPPHSLEKASSSGSKKNKGKKLRETKRRKDSPTGSNKSLETSFAMREGPVEPEIGAVLDASLSHTVNQAASHDDVPSLQSTESVRNSSTDKGYSTAATSDGTLLLKIVNSHAPTLAEVGTVSDDYITVTSQVQSGAIPIEQLANSVKESLLVQNDIEEAMATESMDTHNELPKPQSFQLLKNQIRILNDSITKSSMKSPRRSILPRNSNKASIYKKRHSLIVSSPKLAENAVLRSPLTKRLKEVPLVPTRYGDLSDGTTSQSIHPMSQPQISKESVQDGVKQALSIYLNVVKRITQSISIHPKRVSSPLIKLLFEETERSCPLHPVLVTAGCRGILHEAWFGDKSAETEKIDATESVLHMSSWSMEELLSIHGAVSKLSCVGDLDWVVSWTNACAVLLNEQFQLIRKYNKAVSQNRFLDSRGVVSESVTRGSLHKFFTKALVIKYSGSNEVTGQCLTSMQTFLTDQSANLMKSDAIEESIQKTIRLISVIQKISYCRIEELKSSNISIRMLFTDSIEGTISFQMTVSSDGRNSKLVVNHIHADLVRLPTPNSQTSESIDVQNRFVEVFYAFILCRDGGAARGPLSETSLNQIVHPSQISALLRQIDGHIIVLRRSFTKLTAFMDMGYKVTIDRDTLTFVKMEERMEINLREFISLVQTSCNELKGVKMLHDSKNQAWFFRN